MTATGTKPLTEEHIEQLRVDIALICADDTDDSWMRWLATANRILDIPLLKALLVDNMANLPQERVGHLIRESSKT